MPSNPNGSTERNLEESIRLYEIAFAQGNLYAGADLWRLLLFGRLGLRQFLRGIVVFFWVSLRRSQWHVKALIQRIPLMSACWVVLLQE